MRRHGRPWPRQPVCRLRRLPIRPRRRLFRSLGKLPARMAVDVTKVSELDVEPGELPETMAAWVIREERQGEPKDAFRLEEIEVPEPGAFEVIVRVMAA